MNAFKYFTDRHQTVVSLILRFLLEKKIVAARLIGKY